MTGRMTDIVSDALPKGGWPRLYTSRYQNRDRIIESGFAPVGITLGRPRFRLGYDLVAHYRELGPERWFMNVEDPETFRRHYRHKLHRLTRPVIGSLLLRAAKVGKALDEAAVLNRTLVLLCFEDLSKPGEWCHRQLFAEWWKEQTGEEVLEL